MAMHCCELLDSGGPYPFVHCGKEAHQTCLRCGLAYCPEHIREADRAYVPGEGGDYFIQHFCFGCLVKEYVHLSEQLRDVQDALEWVQDPDTKPDSARQTVS